MNQIIKWIICYLLLLTSHTAMGWTIGSKGRVIGPAIHTTYFLTPQNADTPVEAFAYPGTFVNGQCVSLTSYNIGKAMLKTGDMVDIDAFLLKFVAGTGYNCLTIDYIGTQTAMETFMLEYNGFNYVTSYPETAEVTII